MESIDNLKGLPKQVNFKLDDDFVTKKDLKISLLEFAKEYKLDLINLKLNLLIIGTASAFGYILKILFEILKKT